MALIGFHSLKKVKSPLMFYFENQPDYPSCWYDQWQQWHGLNVDGCPKSLDHLWLSRQLLLG